MVTLVYEQKKQVKNLINIAEELFASYGYDGTSLRMITNKAKMNNASVNYYFSSKEDLYNKIFNSRLQILNDILFNAANQGLDDMVKLETYIETYIENVSQNTNFHKILCREIHLLNQDHVKNELVASSIHSHFELLKRIVSAGILNGVFKNVNVDIFSLSFFTLVTPLIVKTSLVEQLFSEDTTTDGTSEVKEKIKKHFFSILQKQG